jgi:hypothetical protein
MKSLSSSAARYARPKKMRRQRLDERSTNDGGLGADDLSSLRFRALFGRERTFHPFDMRLCSGQANSGIGKSTKATTSWGSMILNK